MLANQLLRSGTSIGANVEEGQAAQSRADFLNKLCIARKEARETHYWLRLLASSNIVHEPRLTELLDEADQLIAILTTITKRIRNSEVRISKLETVPNERTIPNSQFRLLFLIGYQDGEQECRWSLWWDAVRFDRRCEDGEQPSEDG
jgi:four helix bundle protein